MTTEDGIDSVDESGGYMRWGDKGVVVVVVVVVVVMVVDIAGDDWCPKRSRWQPPLHRVPRVSRVPGITRGLNTVTLRAENNGCDAETTWLMVRPMASGTWWRDREESSRASAMQTVQSNVGVVVVVEVYDPKAFSINQIKT
jgi:hypothetical protein